jgi:competence protein ComEA
MEGGSVWERLRSLERRELVGLVTLTVLILGAAGFWYVRSLPRPIRIEAVGGAGGLPRNSGSPPGSSVAPSPSPAAVVVDVAGWVRRPGVYEFAQGDRVIDAIRRAGGARAGADLTSINLAALLADAEQIVVGKSSGGGPVSGMGPGGTGEGGSSGTSPGASGGTESLININTATLDELETLPGIGPALGQRILDYRQEHGPFRSVDDLLNVSGIGDKRLADIRPKVTV